MIVFTSYSQVDTLDNILRSCYKDALRLDSCVNYSLYQDSIINSLEVNTKALEIKSETLLENNNALKLVNNSKEERIKNKDKEIKAEKKKVKKFKILGVCGWGLALILLI